MLCSVAKAMVATIYLCLQLQAQPYVNTGVNRLATVCDISLSLVALLEIWNIAHNLDPDQQGVGMPATRAALPVMVLLIPGLFLVKFLYPLIESARKWAGRRFCV